MCTSEELKDILKKEVAIVRNDLIAHEGREVLGHKELEERINDRIDHVLVAIRASHPSTETMNTILSNQDRIEQKVGTLTQKVDIMFPTVSKDIKDASFWRDFREKFGIGGKTIIQMVLVIGAFIVLFGYIKTILIAFLGIQK